MKIAVINGTEIKGCTYSMKNMFLKALGEDNEIAEFYLPKDCPVFCTGCKSCFLKDMSVCPHSKYIVPIWKSIVKSDLIVITSPTYVFHATGQLKALLDHLGKNWMVHSPQEELFSKQAVIITNAIGMGTKKVIKDIKDSLDFWGVARTYYVQQALYETDWENVKSDVKEKIQKQCDNISKKILKRKQVKPKLKVKVLFNACKFAQKMINKQQKQNGNEETADYKYWKQKGWLDGKKPY